MPAKQYVWLDGKFVDFSGAKVHILTHSLQYGSGIFEGLRAYETPSGTAVFRLRDHMQRFMNSAKIYSMDLGYRSKDIEKAILGTVRRNRLKSCYIRPFAFYNDTRIGLSVKGKKVSVAICAIPFGNYFEGKDRGIRCKISSWQRINSSILPVEAKASGNYVNSIIASLEAVKAGADEAIMLSSEGYVAEGPGENIFLVEDGKLVTPSKSADILLGITRDSVIKVAESIGLVVEEREVHKEELYDCDVAFFTDTAAEITPIISIDSRKVGKGRPGPIKQMIAGSIPDLVHGKHREFGDWLTFV